MHIGQRRVEVVQGDDGPVGVEKLRDVGVGADGLANKVGKIENNASESTSGPVNALLGSSGRCGARIIKGATNGKVQEVLALRKSFVRVVVEGAAGVLEDVGAMVGEAGQLSEPGKP